MHDFDVAIVGGGLIGASLATALQRCGIQVAMIEAAGATQKNVAQLEFDSRVIAIGHAAVGLMQFCGAWPPIDPRRICAYTNMQVEAGPTGKIDFDSTALEAKSSLKCLGYVVENQVLLAGLQASAEASGAACYFDTAVTEIQEDSKGIQIVMDDAKISASLLVAADGGASWVREQVGIEMYRTSFDQMGLVARVEVSQPIQNTAWQRFTSEGPLALLPMSDGAYSIVWSTPTERAQQLLSLSVEEVEECLLTVTQGKFGAVKILDRLRGFPLVSANAKDYFRGRVILCGDSAHQIHPLAGQGANLGFKDVIELTDQLLAAKQSPSGLANRKYLRAYERARKANNTVTDKLMRAFHDMFAGRMSAASPVFALSMSLFDLLSSVKGWLITQAIEAEPVSDDLRALGYIAPNSKEAEK